MRQQRAARPGDEQVLGAAPDGGYWLATQAGLEARRQRPAQTAFAHHHVDECGAHQGWGNAAAGGFYFGEFGHGNV